MREKRGKKQPLFLNFFQSIKFCFIPSKKRVRVLLLLTREIYEITHHTHNNNNFARLLARKRRYTHVLRYKVNVRIIRVRRLGRPRQERLLLETQNPILATDATTVGPIRPVRLSQMARVGFSRAYVHAESVFRPRVLHRDVWVRDL